MTSKSTGEVRFSSKANGQLEGVLSEPSGVSKVGAVVVVHEGHGLNDAIKLQCEQFAQAGYLALAPDLHHGKVAKTDQEMSELMRAFDFGKAVGKIGDTVAHLRSHARSDGKIAIVGFSLGGALTFAATNAINHLACAVPFYGVPRMPPETFAQVKIPICGHFAKNDDWAPSAAVEALQKSVLGGGGQMDVHFYDGVILPQFRGQPHQRRDNAPGVVHGSSETQKIYARVQGGGRTPRASGRPQHPANC